MHMMAWPFSVTQVQKLYVRILNLELFPALTNHASVVKELHFDHLRR